MFRSLKMTKQFLLDMGVHTNSASSNSSNQSTSIDGNSSTIKDKESSANFINVSNVRKFHQVKIFVRHTLLLLCTLFSS